MLRAESLDGRCFDERNEVLVLVTRSCAQCKYERRGVKAAGDDGRARADGKWIIIVFATLGHRRWKELQSRRGHPPEHTSPNEVIGAHTAQRTYAPK